MAVKLDYTNREFQSILEDLRSNLRRDLPGINDFLESNEGRVLLDYPAGIADMLGFTIDRQAAELYIDTLETREALISLLKLIGYQPSNPIPEQVLVTVSRAGQSVESEYVVPKDSKLTADVSVGVIPFTTATSLTIPVGVSSATVLCLQGEWKTTRFTSNGAPFQRFVLQSRRIAQGFIRVFVNGAQWDLAENNTMVRHKATDTRFVTRNLADQRVLVQFGNGGEGFIPPRGAEVKIAFMDTLGPNGHVEANAITSIADSTLVPNNPEPSTGGRDFETIEVARYRYPEIFKTQRRAVTLRDWEVLAQDVAGVMQAKAVDRNIDPSLTFFQVRIYVIGNGGIVSDGLNKTVTDAMRNQRVNATVYDVVSPVQVNVDVKATLTVYRQFNKDDVVGDVAQVLSNFFEMTSEESSEVKLGKNVSYSRLVAAVQGVPGVASVTFVSPNADIPVGSNEFAWLRTVDLTVSGLV